MKCWNLGNRRDYELTGLSTTDIFRFLKASEVIISYGSVTRSMKSKIDEGESASYSELLLGKKKKQSGILVKLLISVSSVKNSKAVKV